MLQVGVQQARANLAAAQAKLDAVKAGARPDDVAQAEEALAQQQAKLAGMQVGGRAEDVAAAEAALSVQRSKLNTIQRGRTELVQQAQSQLDTAQQKLALLQKGASDDIRQAAASAVNADRAAVAAAEAQYRHQRQRSVKTLWSSVCAAWAEPGGPAWRGTRLSRPQWGRQNHHHPFVARADRAHRRQRQNVRPGCMAQTAHRCRVLRVDCLVVPDLHPGGADQRRGLAA